MQFPHPVVVFCLDLVFSAERIVENYQYLALGTKNQQNNSADSNQCCWEVIVGDGCPSFILIIEN